MKLHPHKYSDFNIVNRRTITLITWVDFSWGGLVDRKNPDLKRTRDYQKLDPKHAHGTTGLVSIFPAGTILGDPSVSPRISWL